MAIPENGVTGTATIEDNGKLLVNGETGSGSWSGGSEDGPQKQCAICYGSFPLSAFPVLDKNMKCKHAACLQCYRLYLTVQITESRVSGNNPIIDNRSNS